MDRNAITVLLACLGYGSEAGLAEQLVHFSAEEWRAVVALAGQHSVAPLLHHRLKSLKILLPGDVAEKLKQVYLRNTARNICLYRELGKVLRQLREQDIAVIALKGIHLAEAVYEDSGLRMMGDIDLLVEKDDLMRVEQILLALGYEPDERNRVISKEKHDFHYTHAQTGVQLEIHWALFASELPFRIDMNGLWGRARSVMLAQNLTLVLSPEDLLLHLCIHTARHIYDMRIRMLCDVGEIVRRYEKELDWDTISARARQWGIVRAAYVIMWLAQELLDVAVPDGWLASLEPTGVEERYLALARRQTLAARRDESMVWHLHTARLWGLEGLGNKMTLTRDRLFPSRESMAIMYPAPVNSWRIYLYYPVHIKNVLVRQATTLWRLARGDPQARAVAERTNQVTELRDWLMSK